MVTSFCYYLHTSRKGLSFVLDFQHGKYFQVTNVNNFLFKNPTVYRTNEAGQLDRVPGGADGLQMVRRSAEWKNKSNWKGCQEVTCPAACSWTPSSSRLGSGGIGWDQVGSDSQWQAANSAMFCPWQEVLSAGFRGRAESSKEQHLRDFLSPREDSDWLQWWRRCPCDNVLSLLLFWHIQDFPYEKPPVLSLISESGSLRVSFSLFQLAAVHPHRLWYFLFLLLYVVFHQEFGLSASITYKTISSPRPDSFLTVWLLHWGLSPVLQLTPLPWFLT